MFRPHWQPGGAIMAVANGFLDFTGPAAEGAAERTQMRTARLTEQIQALNPNYRLPSLGVPQTADGQARQIDGLRFDLAIEFLRRGELKPLQLEAFRFVQRETDEAYDQTLALARARRLPIRLSSQQAIGTRVDSMVRTKFRERLNASGIDWNGKGPVRVNKLETVSSGGDLRRRRPDARVGDVAFDVTISEKSLKTAQVRGFFNSDLKTKQVIIIRPTQIGPESSYIIVRPGEKR
jgi:hypothetical protein